MQEANSRQVGGSHYRASYQHWDLVADAGLPYFPAQITRYAGRWRKKNGVQDVEKAIHYFEKLWELHESLRLALPQGPRPLRPLETFANENQMSPIEWGIFYGLLRYTTMNELKQVRGLLEELLLEAKRAEISRCRSEEHTSEL